MGSGDISQENDSANMASFTAKYSSYDLGQWAAPEELLSETPTWARKRMHRFYLMLDPDHVQRVL